MLARVPTHALAEAAATFLRDHEASESEIIIDAVHRVKGDPPDLRQLAEEYPKYKRVDLASRYGVSPSTLDRWVAEARRRGLLPPATTGRPRKRDLPGNSPAVPKDGKPSGLTTIKRDLEGD